MIQQLFAMLTACNAADSDAAESWQHPDDSLERFRERGNGGAFGHLARALVSLAGQPIYEYWCETSEVDLTLANRTTLTPRLVEAYKEYLRS